MRRCIYDRPDWPKFRWNQKPLEAPLAAVRHRQGRLLGRMESLGFNLRKEAVLQTLTLDVLKSSEIEGEILNREQVRSSVARRLGMNVAGVVPVESNVEGVVEMTMDATQNFDKPLTAERLFGWHGALFPSGRSGLKQVHSAFTACQRRFVLTAMIITTYWNELKKRRSTLLSGWNDF